MKLSEMKRLPKKAGLARLQFGSRAIKREPPYRSHDLIVLPKDSEAEFYPLQNGRQFLFRFPLRNGTWFGGTDENPFLVELRNEAFRVFERSGQKGFYQALKPEVITAIEKRYNVTSKRQGDLWAAPIPYSWDEVNFLAALYFGRTPKPKSVKSISIYGTRHRLTGLCMIAGLCINLPDELEFLLSNSLRDTVFAEGEIECPDHSLRKIKGVHVLAQTQHLYNPVNAD